MSVNLPGFISGLRSYESCSQFSAGLNFSNKVLDDNTIAYNNSANFRFIICKKEILLLFYPSDKNTKIL